MKGAKKPLRAAKRKKNIGDSSGQQRNEMVLVVAGKSNKKNSSRATGSPFFSCDLWCRLANKKVRRVRQIESKQPFELRYALRNLAGLKTEGCKVQNDHFPRGKHQHECMVCFFPSRLERRRTEVRESKFWGTKYTVSGREKLE